MQEFKKKFTWIGTLRYHGEEYAAHISIDYNISDPTSLSLLLTIIGDPSKNKDFSMKNFLETETHLRLETENKCVLSINGIHNPEIYNKVICRCEIISFYEIQHDCKQETLEKATCKCLLIPNAPIWGYEFDREHIINDITWIFSSIKYKLFFEIHNECGLTSKEFKQRKQLIIPTLYMESPNISSKDILDFINDKGLLFEDIFDVCLMLAFCFRKNMLCYEIYIYDANENNILFGRKSVSTAIYSKNLEPLIHHHSFDENVFSNLFLCYKNLDENMRKCVKHSIGALLDSREKNSSIEKKFFSCHSALDSICSADFNTILSGKDLNKLLKYLRKKVDEYPHLPPEAPINTIKERLIEISRWKYFDKIINTCEKHNINICDIWPHGQFKNEIKYTIRQRNDLVHTARLTDIPSAIVTCYRLQLLVERILIKILNFPDNKLHHLYNLELRMLNSNNTLR